MTDLTNKIETSLRWIVEQQQGNGGWGEQRGRYTNAFNTAEVVLAVMDAGVQRLPSGPRTIADAVGYLLEHQCPEGEQAGCWFRDVLRDGTAASVPVPDTCRTAVAVEALVRAGRAPDDPQVALGIRWVAGVRNDDGGWHYGSSGPSRITPTCRALSMLLEARRAGAPGLDDLITGGLASLDAQRRPNGSFGASDHLQAANTVGALLVLQKARRSDFAVPLDHETRGIEWMLAHPDRVMRPVEECVELDPAIPEATYEFVHSLDALTLRVLSASANQGHRATRVCHDAQISLKDRMDEDGGIFGFRTFTWSAAHALSALQEASSKGVAALPEREPEAVVPSSAQEAGNAWNRPVTLVLGLVAVLVVTVGVMIAAFAVGGAALGVGVVIVIVMILGFFLVLVGRMTGQSWGETAAAALGRLPGHPPGGAE